MSKKSKFWPKKSILRQKCTKKVRKKKFPRKMLLCNFSYEYFNPVLVSEMLWSDLQNDISSVWRIFAQISRKSEFLEPNQKIQILSKKSILRQKCTKKIREKKFSQKVLLCNRSYGQFNQVSVSEML